jgi:hypothetical protein
MPSLSIFIYLFRPWLFGAVNIFCFFRSRVAPARTA